jgi:hypothetical protein
MLNDRRVARPLNLALRRLEQLAEALKPEPPHDPSRRQPNQPGMGSMMPPASNGPSQDLIPPQAQLKVLRALQAELNERTAEFAKAHPNPEKFTDAEREELQELEHAQREIAALFEQLSRLLTGSPPSSTDQPNPSKETP